MGDSKTPEIIGKLRESRKMTQAEFARAVGVDQSRVSQWEAGVAAPSAEAWMKLGAFVAEDNPAEALFLWTQSGLDTRTLVEIADACLRANQGEVDLVLATAEKILQERETDAAGLEDQGKIVSVFPYCRGEWKSQESLAPIPLPSSLIRNRASAFYIVSNQRGGLFTAGDLIVFDARGAATGRYGPFEGERVLMSFANGVAPSELLAHSRLYHHQPVWHDPGLVLGTISHNQRPPVTEVVLKDDRGHSSVLAILQHPARWQRRFQKLKDQREHDDLVAAEHVEELAKFTLPEGCEIMGRFIALLAAGQK